jgi:L-ascorbate metabolism protein UlaG (beta-lactamase superfamily)
MRITKFGQCCLLIEVSGKRILTDPGQFSVSQNEVNDLDIVLITHEHADHLHTESLTVILKNNPQAKVITNESVGKILTDLGVTYEVLPETTPTECCGVSIEAFPGKHVEIFEEVGQVQNTGFFVAHELFYPGDAYTLPNKPVPVLALPVAGPWCKAADAINYAITVNPKNSFPVHDAVLNDEGLTLTHGIFKTQLAIRGINFTSIKSDETIEYS